MRKTTKKKLALFLGVVCATTAFCSNAVRPWLGLAGVWERGNGLFYRTAPVEQYIEEQGLAAFESRYRVQQKAGLRHVILQIIPQYDPDHDPRRRVYFLSSHDRDYTIVRNGVWFSVFYCPGFGRLVEITLPQVRVASTEVPIPMRYLISYGRTRREEAWQPIVKIE
ncbi:MAG: hypothetical protein LBJ38_01555 [Oscillospiraceae bacterium]|jgi:hypothetical protein|nr:hypothetical protein [Oscillospiraceae bacterium]